MMKTTIIVVISSVISLMLSALFSFDSDPFGARTNIHKITSLSPNVAYASSDEGMYEVSMGESVSNIPSIDAQDVMFDLCENPSDELLGHPKFNEWCY